VNFGWMMEGKTVRKISSWKVSRLYVANVPKDDL